MRRGVTEKFTQDMHCRDVLLRTGNARLIKASSDAYWGSGLDGSGRNMLGIILEEVREALA